MAGRLPYSFLFSCPVSWDHYSRWPGNDASLLTEPHSLSVDEVSPDLRTCWNIAPSGYRGVQAVLAYLEALQVSDGVVNASVAEIGRIRS